MFVLWTKIVLIWMGCVLSCRPVGVIEGEQFISLPECAFSEWLICGVQSMTAMSFPAGRTRTSRGSQCYAADGEDAATSVGSVN